MTYIPFNRESASAENPERALQAMECGLRLELIGRLKTALGKPPGAMDAGTLKHRHVLEIIEHALTNPGGSERVFYPFEPTRPVFPSHAGQGFYEGLVRVRNGGNRLLMPEELFGALLDPGLDPGLPHLFRTWLTAALTIDFYRSHPAETRLSLNIFPYDLDSDFRQTLTECLTLARQCGYENIILEASESGEWTEDKAAFLAGLGCRIAIDDYGAPNGRHDCRTLALFSGLASPDKPLIVKLDGAIVESFMEKGDRALVDRIGEIKKYAPGAVVAAEWIISTEYMHTLREKLRAHGLEDSIHLGQDRDFTDLSPIFPEPPKPQPGPRPS